MKRVIAPFVAVLALALFLSTHRAEACASLGEKLLVAVAPEMFQCSELVDDPSISFMTISLIYRIFAMIVGAGFVIFWLKRRRVRYISLLVGVLFLLYGLHFQPILWLILKTISMVRGQRPL